MWKEYAYEKFDWEHVFDPWDRINPWDRPPIDQRPPLVVLPPVVKQLPFSQGAPGLRGMDDWKEVPSHGGCADFSRLTVGDGPNPAITPPFAVTVYDYAGNQAPNNRIVDWGGVIGLDVGFSTDIRIRGRCPSLQATLAHFSQPAMIEAYNTDGSLAGTASMGDTQGTEQTLTIQGSSIEFVRIVSPSNETILIRLCCCCDTTCAPCQGKPIKEIKEGKEKEFKEGKDKELKEYKEGKEIKEKEFKEFKEIKEVRETVDHLPRGEGSSVEDRLAALETMMGMGGSSHFIPGSQRPDLSHGALRNEPDGNTRARMRRQRGR